MLLDGLNKGLPKLAIGSNNKTRKIYSVSSTSLNASSAAASISSSASSSSAHLATIDDEEGDSGGGGGCGRGGGVDACACKNQQTSTFKNEKPQKGDGSDIEEKLAKISRFIERGGDGNGGSGCENHGSGGGENGYGEGGNTDRFDEEDPCDDGVCNCEENDDETGERTKSVTEKGSSTPIPFPLVQI